jgi:hypothetical protein
MNRESIEQLLRNTPGITPPKDLSARLKRDVTLPRAGMAETVDRPPNRSGWLHRWLPTIGFAAWFFGCVVVFGYQANRISELSRQQEIANERSALAAPPGGGEGSPQQGASHASQGNRELEEMQRLQAEIEQLRKEVAELAALRTENARLRSELKAQTTAVVKPEEDFFAVQQEKASRIKCINNIKQFCLAARLEANDRNSDVLAKDASSLKPYLGSSENVLFCADGRTAYQIASPGASTRDPSIVFVRCLVHNNVGLNDGSAHQLSPDRKLVETASGLRLER